LLAILDILARDLRRLPAAGGKLRDDGERLARVDRLARALEAWLAASLGIVAATALIAGVALARVGRHGRRLRVRFEDVRNG